ncbi:hypothetical protein LTR56_023182 [Elasticomyces elasticus]|nr:hypothetical protein LTR56_023182 [Elasticomyces elasticus]
MPMAVKLSLSSLASTLSTVPNELLNLAASLLAQSRTKAAPFELDEEIGALEIAKPSPPVELGVYTKIRYFTLVM